MKGERKKGTWEGRERAEGEEKVGIEARKTVLWRERERWRAGRGAMAVWRRKKVCSMFGKTDRDTGREECVAGK